MLSRPASAVPAPGLEPEFPLDGVRAGTERQHRTSAPEADGHPVWALLLVS